MGKKRRYLALPVLFLVLLAGIGFIGFLSGGDSQAALADNSAPTLPHVPTDGTEALPPGTSIQTILPNMTNPIAMAFDPQGRLFYTEKTTGLVRLFANGSLQANPVITYSVDSCSERGLLGIAVDPLFTSTHYIYVYYTAYPGAACGSTTNRVARFVETNGVGTGSTDIFSSTQTAGNHNGGNIHFGPDGKLYISIGDNATSSNAQNVGVKNGKMHRINSDGTIPSDNPVFTQTGALPSLYVIGLRNSFDFTFDPLTPGRIFASENGPSCDDEMNRIQAGYNYGWRGVCEDDNPSPQYNTIAPLWYLGTGGGGSCCEAPTGITVYSGNQIPQWQNHLFMAAYNTSALRHFYLNAARTVVTATNIVQGVTIGTDIETGPDGALWYIQGGGYTTGILKRIVGPSGSETPTPTGVVNTPTRTLTSTPLYTSTVTPTPQCPPLTEDVAIQEFAFAPQNMTVHVGTTIRWTNHDLDYHTSTSTEGAWDSGNIQQNESYSLIFNTPGIYNYICTPHPFMKGSITVLAGCPPVPTNTPQSITSTPTRTRTANATPTLCPINFTDVQPSDYFYTPVRYLYCRNIISGYGTEFRPYNNTSRGQLCKIVTLGFSLPINTAGGPHFTDVTTLNVFYPYVETLYNRGIVSGFGALFKPNDNVSRGQLSKIVVLAAAWSLRTPTTATFTDVPVGSAFFSYVETAVCHGIVSGYGTLFKPSDPATRGQISKIVYLALTSTSTCP